MRRAAIEQTCDAPRLQTVTIAEPMASRSVEDIIHSLQDPCPLQDDRSTAMLAAH